MYYTDSQILQALANRLNVTSAGQLPARWNEIVSSTHSTAYREILGKLLARGFSQAQVDAWDDLATYERELSMFLALSEAGTEASYEADTLRTLDRRRDLLTVELFIGGVWQQPAASPNSLPGQAMTGQQDTHSRFAHSWGEHCGAGGDFHDI